MDLTDLPLDPKRREALETFCQRLGDALGDDLVAVLAHGDAVTGDGLADLSELEVLLVVSSLDREHLDLMAPLVADARRQARISVLTLAPEEIRGATDVFPIKFLELQRTGRLVCGADPLRSLEIDRAHLRLRCEQELRNISLKLRHFYLLRAGGHQGLAPVLGQFLPALVRALRYLLILQGETDEGLDSEAVLQRACDVLKLDALLAAPLLAAARGAEGREKLVKLLVLMMKLAGKAAEAADQLEDQSC